MRSFGRRTRARDRSTAVAAWLLGVRSRRAVREAADREGALRGGAAARRAGARPADQLHDTHRRPPTWLTQVSQVMTSFESIVRRFPTSGYADNALWQAASLADAAYQRLNRAEDRDRALKLYRWLVQEYPSSSFVKQANAKIASLGRRRRCRRSPMPPVPAAPSRSSGCATPVCCLRRAPVAPSPDRATLTSIQRVVLPGVVRVTLELDREVAYREERLAGPSRLFFDLKNVQLTPALMDKVLTYGSDVVNKIRVGRHPDNTVRVVLDLEDVSKYSVFTLYSPFRLVIDAERIGGRQRRPPLAPAPPPAPVPAAAAAAEAEPTRLCRHRDADRSDSRPPIAGSCDPAAQSPDTVPPLAPVASPTPPSRTPPADSRWRGNSD